MSHALTSPAPSAAPPVSPPARTAPARTAPAVPMALAASIAAADLLLYGHDVGLGFVAFLALLPVLAGLVARPLEVGPTRAEWARNLAVTLAALAPLVGQANPLTILVAVAGTFYAALSLQGLMPAGWGARVAEALVQAVLGPLRWFPIARAGLRLENASGAGASPLLWALPAACALVFVWLLADANPLIERAVAAIDLWAALGWLFSERALFWLAVAVFAAPFLRAGAPWAGRLATGLAMMAMLRPVGSDEARAAKTGRDGAFAARALLLFNAVFAVQTASDLLYLWGGLALPDGMTHAEYAHRGAYSLLATAILAAIFVVWATRPRGPAEGSPLVAKLVLLWVAQNLVLLASSVLRLDLYVEAYALTYWRVAAFIWMALVAAGFVLIVARALTGRSLPWLVSANVAVLVGTLYAVSFNDWADTIARHNLATGRVDHAHLRSLGAPALPAVVAYRRAARPGAFGCKMGRTEDLLRVRAGRFAPKAMDPRAWTGRKARVADAALEAVVPYAPCPPPSRRRTSASKPALTTQRSR